MGHGRNPGFISGDRWLECDRCGIEYRLSKIKEEWNGLQVCEKCWEPRHTLDFLRGKSDTITPQGPVRPPSVATFTDVDDNYPNTTGNPDYEIPDATHLETEDP
jgi:hypothetical protein